MHLIYKHFSSPIRTNLTLALINRTGTRLHATTLHSVLYAIKIYWVGSFHDLDAVQYTKYGHCLHRRSLYVHSSSFLSYFLAVIVQFSHSTFMIKNQIFRKDCLQYSWTSRKGLFSYKSYNKLQCLLFLSPNSTYNKCQRSPVSCCRPCEWSRCDPCVRFKMISHVERLTTHPAVITQPHSNEFWSVLFLVVFPRGPGINSTDFH